MIDWILIKWDYYKAVRGSFPTKRLIKHCLTNMEGPFRHKHQQIAHMYAYDSTVSKEDLELIHKIYGTCTRERIRQLLMKFVRKYYK